MVSLIPYLNAIIFGFLAVLFCLYCLKKKSRDGKLRKAPEPPGAWPVVGHLPVFAHSRLLHLTLTDMAEKYGPIFTVRLGVRPALVVSSWEMAKELFTTHDLSVASRPQMIAAKHLGYDFAVFGFAEYNPFWRDMRKIVTLEVLSNRRLEQLKHVRISEVESFGKQLFNFTSKKNGTNPVTIDMRQWFEELTLNLIIRMIAGKTYFGPNAEVGEEEARGMQKSMRQMFHFLTMFVVGDAVPFLGWLDVGGHEKEMRKTAKELDRILGGWLEDHKRKRASGQFKEDQDFMDVMLSVLDGKSVGGYDADTVTKATSLSMIAGGSDTTAVTLTWILSLILNNRHVLKNAQEELDTIVGKERLVNDSDISKLVYLQAIVKETLRLYPTIPLSALREFINDCTVAGYHVPKGSWLILNTWKIQKDPRTYEDPLEFKPERFLTRHKNLDVRGLNYELIPFGSGRRGCAGISFGLQTVQLALATLLQGFEISTPNDAPVDMTQSPGLTNMKGTPLDVILTPRLSLDLYV